MAAREQLREEEKEKAKAKERFPASLQPFPASTLPVKHARLQPVTPFVSGTRTVLVLKLRQEIVAAKVSMFVGR